MPRRRATSDALLAAAAAGLLGGAPSTLVALARGEDPLAAARAAGALLLGDGCRRGRERGARAELAAGVPVHAALSLGWTSVLAAALPRRRRPLWGAAAGLAIAALDLGLLGRRVPRIAALRQPPQWADHVAFGAVAGAVLRVRGG